MGEEQAPTRETTGLTLRASEETGRLHASFVPDTELKAGLDEEELRDRMREAGFADWLMLDKAYTEFLQLARKAESPITREIAERRDAELSIAVGRDEMHATLTLTRAYGGKPVTRADVDEALAEHNVVHGLDRKAIDAALAAGECEPRVIARGEPPENGEDARFESLIKDTGPTGPRIDDNGLADYRELGTFVTVEPGDPLMRRIPPTPGRGGLNVHGLVVPPKPGKDTHFSGALKGAVTQPEDPDLLVAEIGGVPVILPDGVMVDPLIQVDAIDLSTGNLDFDGSVSVRGDVVSGSRIRATGEVRIGGTLEGATIETPGAVTVTGGVVGQGATGEGAGTGSTARIRCGGTLTARFIANAIVDVGEDVVVSNGITHSRISAKRRIVVGTRSSQKSQVVGGELKAGELVQAAILGSPASITTRILVGHDPETRSAHEHLQRQRRANEQKRQDLGRAFQLLTRKKPPDAARIEAIRVQLKDLYLEMQDLERRGKKLEERMAVIANARVAVGKRVHANVEIVIGNDRVVLREDRGGGTFTVHEGEIVVA